MTPRCPDRWELRSNSIVDPSISHIASEPVLLLRHRMSASPSPLKSPIPATLQDDPGETAPP